jgi:tRNA A37 N6-isopentenylltransferase MiaA
MSGEDKHLWVVMGPAACGKTTVGRYLASQVESSIYVEGDWVSTYPSPLRIISSHLLTPASLHDSLTRRPMSTSWNSMSP